MKYLKVYHIDHNYYLHELMGRYEFNYEDGDNSLTIINPSDEIDEFDGMPSDEFEYISLNDVVKVELLEYNKDYKSELLSSKEIYPFDGCNSPWNIKDYYLEKYRYNQSVLNPIEKEILEYSISVESKLKCLKNTLDREEKRTKNTDSEYNELIIERKTKLIEGIKNCNEFILKLNRLNNVFNQNDDGK